jgi:nucleotide-binding universal stress UspA family protein
MKEIVVGYDGSAEAEHALARAADLARAFPAKLVVVCAAQRQVVLRPAPTLAPTGPAVVSGTGVMPAPTAETLPPGESEVERLPHTAVAQRQLDDARRVLAGSELDAEFLAEEGELGERLIDVAERRDADLIVVGAREHGFLERMLARPVEDSVAREAECDVLLVH